MVTNVWKLTAQEAALWAALAETFGDREFTAETVLREVPLNLMPDLVRREVDSPSSPPKNPARILGRWLAHREGWHVFGQYLHPSRKIHNVKLWCMRAATPVQRPDQYLTDPPEAYTKVLSRLRSIYGDSPFTPEEAIAAGGRTLEYRSPDTLRHWLHNVTNMHLNGHVIRQHGHQFRIDPSR